MGRKTCSLRDRAVRLMGSGRATAHEIAVAMSLPPNTVQSWRKRAGITDERSRRIAYVRRLMTRGQSGDIAAAIADLLPADTGAGDL